MALQAIDLQVDDVSAATTMLSAAYGWHVVVDDPNLGELHAGGLPGQLIVDAYRKV